MSSETVPQGKRNRHSITHSLVMERYKKFKLSTIFLFISWGFFLAAILNSAFLFIFKESLMGDFFFKVMGNIYLRVLMIGFMSFIALDFARMLGVSSIVAPFNRFIRHIGTVHQAGGEKFIIRKKDEYFLPVAIAFNQMINRLKNNHEKEKEETLFLLNLVEKSQISLSESEKTVIEKIRNRVHSVPSSDVEKI